MLLAYWFLRVLAIFLFIYKIFAGYVSFYYNSKLVSTKDITCFMHAQGL